MDRTYYEDAVYFSWKACMKQLKEKEMLTPPDGVSINEFDIAKASFDTEFNVHDDADEYMLEEFAAMQPGELKVIRVEDFGTHCIGIKTVDVTGTAIVPKEFNGTTREVFDDEGNNHGDMTLEAVQQKMLDEKFANAYFICEAGAVTKLQPAPMAEGSLISLSMLVSKYAVFGRM